MKKSSSINFSSSQSKGNRFPGRLLGMSHLCIGMLVFTLIGSDFKLQAQHPDPNLSNTGPSNTEMKVSTQMVVSAKSGATMPEENSDRQYRIGPGDLLEVKVFNRPQLSLDAVRVDGKGMIRLPLLDAEIQAACRTEADLAKEIANQYREYQRNPQIFVLVKEYNSQPVAVIGSVEKPGRFQLQRRIRLLELLSLVGGPNEKAGLRIHVAHSGDDSICNPQGEIVAQSQPTDSFEVFTLSDTLSGDTQSNPYVLPGDIVTVPEADQAFVVGNVYKPTSIPLKNTIRLSEAIAMSGGVLPDSNINRICVVRQVPGAPIKQEMFVSLKEINQRRAEDVVLLAGDIVEVQALSGRKFLRSLLTSMGPALVNLPLLIIR